MTDEERERIVIVMASVMDKPFEEAYPLVRQLVWDIKEAINSPGVIRWVRANAEKLNEMGRVK